MRSIKTSLVSFFMMFLFGSLACAEGFTSIEGKIDGGWEIIIDTEPPLKISMFKRMKDGTPSNEQEYQNEGCTLTSTGGSVKEVRILTCPSNGKTPLAGTVYIGRRNKEPVCLPEFIYTCIEGCSSKSKAPKKMKQDPWEC